MKNVLKIAFSVVTIAGLVSCTAYADPYANAYGDPYYDNGYYYAPQGYYGGGGYWGNDGYYYRNNMNYYYDNGMPYYYQNYNNSRRKVYLERRSSGEATSARPNNGFRGNVNDGTSNNGGFRNSNRQNNNQRSNSNGFRNQQQNTQQPRNNGGFRTIPVIPIIRITEDSGIIQDQEISRRLPSRTPTGTPTEVVLDKTIINNETDS